MVDAIVSKFPNADRTPLDRIRMEQLNTPFGNVDYLETERQALEELLQHAGIQGPILHKNIFDPNPRIVEQRLTDAIANHPAVFLALLPTMDVIYPHIAHVGGYDDPYLILNSEQVHVGIIYDQLYSHRRIDIFIIEKPPLSDHTP